MSSVNPHFIEKFQLMLKQDPKSKIFAPLAEAYRKLGLLKEAEQVCKAGLQHHPRYASGHLALAKIFLDKDQNSKAEHHLLRAVELSSENILAYQLLGDCYLKQKKPKEALKNFKMVLFMNPHHQRARAAVKKLESLTADEYEAETFELARLESAFSEPQEEFDIHDDDHDIADIKRSLALERYLSLADAFFARNDLDKVSMTLEKAESQLGPVPELVKRRKLLNHYLTEPEEVAEPLRPRRELSPKTAKKVQYLESLLDRVREREMFRPT